MEYPIQILYNNSPRYPYLLKQIHQPPSPLYYRGNISLLSNTPRISIVGARKATRYGKAVVQRMVRELVLHDCVTVSGLAYGIDSAVHTATLEEQGKTIAVLGSSVEDGEIYPQAHTSLAQRILENDGLLLSEFPVGTVTYPGNFPQRNRIISGLAMATIIVEASMRSGSLITARFAQEQNREVFAVPGPITSPQSEGTNWLIEEGATPWLSIDSFLNVFPQFQQEQQKKIFTFSGNEGLIYPFLQEPHTIDALVLKTGLPAHIVMQTITTLLLSNAIHDIGNGQYVQE